MGWKEWSYWLKGIIFFVIVWVIVLFLWGLTTTVSEGGKCSIIPFLGSGTLLGCFLAPVLLGLFGIIPVIIIGALIGWIYGKTKSR